MKPEEHYALSLLFFALIGFLIGIANGTLDDQKRGSTKFIDLLYSWGFFFAIAYGIFGFKYVDGRYFIWVIPLVIAAVAAHFGRRLATSRWDISVCGLILCSYVAVPLLFHFVLPQ